jgi:hypothetical protein
MPFLSLRGDYPFALCQYHTLFSFFASLHKHTRASNINSHRYDTHTTAGTTRLYCNPGNPDIRFSAFVTFLLAVSCFIFVRQNGIQILTVGYSCGFSWSGGQKGVQSASPSRGGVLCHPSSSSLIFLQCLSFLPLNKTKNQSYLFFNSLSCHCIQYLNHYLITSLENQHCLSLTAYQPVRSTFHPTCFTWPQLLDGQQQLKDPSSQSATTRP